MRPGGGEVWVVNREANTISVIDVAANAVSATIPAADFPIRVKFTPVKVPLFPGQPLPELAWSEMRYEAYCFVVR